MLITPRNDTEKKAFFDFERSMQLLADNLYRSRGFMIHRNGDKLKDVTLTKENKSHTVEEKFRDGYRSDILVEIIQDLISFAPGWYFETRCDYLHYFFCGQNNLIELNRINWKLFKTWFANEFLPKHKIGNYVVSNKGWGLTINIPVPKTFIPKNMMITIPCLDTANSTPK